MKGVLFDTMIAHYLIKPEGKHGLNDLAEDYLNYTTTRSVPQEKIKEYAAEDADLTWQIKEILEKELIEKHLETLAGKIEMPLIYVLCDMEMKGFKVNVDVLKKYSVI